MASAGKKSSALYKGMPLKLADIVVGDTLGTGTFSRVRIARHKASGKYMALKILKKAEIIRLKQVDHIMSEKAILAAINHPMIISLYGTSQDDLHLYMYMEFVSGGELFSHLRRAGRFTNDTGKFFAASIILALQHLHALDIVYRDLKPENLLLDAEGHIKICDFGLSKENVVDDTVKSICGTPEYLAPEVIQRKPYGKSVDWWSMGTLIFEMIGGLPPFYHTNRQVMYRKILRDQLKQPKTMSDQAFDLCSKMLNRDPQQRLGQRGAEEIMKHPWFSDIDWEALLKREVKPPYNPNVKGPEDISHVDSMFTGEQPTITPTPAGAQLINPELFQDFTYVKVGEEILSVKDDDALPDVDAATAEDA